eukprot:6480015-Pyramimonas_sp.AAC.1
MDQYYSWMEEDKQEVRKVLAEDVAEDAVSSLSDDFAKCADEALNPKTRKKLKCRKTGGKQSIFDRLHKTGLRGSLNSSQEVTEKDAAALVALELNKETQIRETREAKPDTEKPKAKAHQATAVCTGIRDHTDGQSPTDPDRSRRRAMGPMACTDADKHAS